MGTQRRRGSLKPPAWQYWLSYLWPVTLRHYQTEVHPDLTLLLRRGRYQLCTPHAIYSYGDLYVNFAKTFRQIDLSKLPGKEVLVLGLGLGSVIQLLEEEHDFQGSYTAVEMDEAIIDLAQLFTLGELEVPISYVATDAALFLKVPSEMRYDLILLDVFHDVEIPRFFWKRECLEFLREKLSPGGLLLDNRLYRSPKDRKRTSAFFKEEFKGAFPHAGFLEIDGNCILLQDRSYLRSA